MSVGCLEPQFFKAFIERFVEALPNHFRSKHDWTPDASTQFDRDEWPKLKDYLEQGFKTRTRDEWGAVFMGRLALLSSHKKHPYLFDRY